MNKQKSNLPSNWKWVTVNDVTLPVQKIQPKEAPEKSFTYIDISSIDNELNKIVDPKTYFGNEAPSRARQLILENDVLFSTVRTYLKNIALVPGVYDQQIASTGFSVLRASSELNSKFLFYYCLTDSFLDPLNNIQRGTSYPAVRDGDVRAQPFPLPPKKDQEKIVSKLEELFSQLDAGVAGLKRAQVALKHYRASVLKAAFEGRLVPQNPNDESVEDILNFRKDEIEPEKVLPIGWNWSKLNDLAESIQYGYTQSSTKIDVGPKFLRITDIQDGTVNWEEVPFCEIDEKEIEKYQLYSGDIVFARTGATTGKSFLIENCPQSVFASYLIRIKLRDIVYPEYCYLYFQSPMYWSQIMTTKKGSTQPGVNARILSKMNVPIAPYKEQKRIVDETNRLLSIANYLESLINDQINLYKKMRFSILASAFKGNFFSSKEKHDSKVE